jgi:peptide/nickel transport system permease protein
MLERTMPERATTERATTERAGPERALRVGAGVAEMALAVGLLYLVLVPLGHLPGIVRAVGVVALAGLAYAGARKVGRGIWGAGFDAGYWLAAGWLAALILAAVFADALPLGNASDTTQTIGQSGYAAPDLFSAHPLGTNGFGLDLLARSIYGARVSLLTVGLAVAVSLTVGGFIGMLSGYFRRWVDLAIGIFADASLVIPALVLLIAFAAVLGPPRSVPGAVLKSGLALAVVGIPTMIRLARASTMVYAPREFVLASRAMGARHLRVLRRDLLPNVARPLLSYAFIIAAVLIVAEGSLAFLGLGLQQPTPSWGNMIAEGGLRDLRRHPHLALVPGTFMFLTVFSLNIVGERLRARWDARESNI